MNENEDGVDLSEPLVDGSDNAHVQVNDPYSYLDKVIEDESNKVEESIDIYVGKEFRSDEEAYNFYNLYALIKGFSIRKNQRGTSRKGVSTLRFVCSKQGLSNRQKNEGKPVDCSTKQNTPEKVRSATRTDCLAYMRVKLVEGGIWQVTKFHDEHNHPLAPNTPSKNRNLRSHRCLTIEDIEIIRKLSDQNIGPSKIAEYLATLHGGKKRVLFRTEEWVPAYFRGIFFAGMTTTQRSEGMNALFKMWVTTHTSIYKFVCKIDNIIENIWQREGDEDMRTMNEEPALWSKFPLEFHARQVYTRKVFSVFKELLKDSCLGPPIEKEQGTLYEVRIDYNPCYKKWKPVSYPMKVDKNAELFSCNCKGFDFEGLLCPHALKVMWIHGIQQLLSHYILKRWCKNANTDVRRPINERSRDVGNSTALQMFRAKTIKSQFNHLIDLASKDIHSFNMADAKLGELVEHLKALQLDEVPGNEVVMDVNVGDVV